MVVVMLDAVGTRLDDGVRISYRSGKCEWESPYPDVMRMVLLDEHSYVSEFVEVDVRPGGEGMEIVAAICVRLLETLSLSRDVADDVEKKGWDSFAYGAEDLVSQVG
jgi:hypothetical protein